MSDQPPPGDNGPVEPPRAPGWGVPPPPPAPGQDQPYGQPPGGGQVPYPQPYGQQQYGDPYGQQYGAPYGQRSSWPSGPVSNTKAQWALGVGLASIVGACCSLVLGLAGVAAIVLGVQARREIAASGGQQTGEGLALTGIITGAAAVALTLLIGLFFVALVVGGGIATSP